MNEGGKNWFMFSLMQSITFAAGVYIVLQGVRMVIAEIVPAFKGISDKLVPNAKPALDCPVVFPYAPNAVLVGFLSSFIAGVVGMFLLWFLNMTVIIRAWCHTSLWARRRVSLVTPPADGGARCSVPLPMAC